MGARINMNMARFLELLEKEKQSKLTNNNEFSELYRYETVLENQILYNSWKEYCLALKFFTQGKLNHTSFTQILLNKRKNKKQFKTLLKARSQLEIFPYNFELEKINTPTDLSETSHIITQCYDMLNDVSREALNFELFKNSLRTLYLNAIQ
jgi:hypothetical protein